MTFKKQCRFALMATASLVIMAASAGAARASNLYGADRCVSNVKPRIKNKVLGTWRPLSVHIDPNGQNIELYSHRPTGLLTFTTNGHFSVVLNNPDLPHFASNALAGGTAAENKAVLANAGALYGIYAVDHNGDFSCEHVDGALFPNWNGIIRHSGGRLTMTIEGNTMREDLRDPGVPAAIVIWQRVP